MSHRTILLREQKEMSKNPTTTDNQPTDEKRPEQKHQKAHSPVGKRNPTWIAATTSRGLHVKSVVASSARIVDGVFRNGIPVFGSDEMRSIIRVERTKFGPIESIPTRKRREIGQTRTNQNTRARNNNWKRESKKKYVRYTKRALTGRVNQDIVMAKTQPAKFVLTERASEKENSRVKKR
jgi:hypothetical protein